MSNIGIKLADGSFYKIMEEGSAQTKKIQLTTANNNQTCVMVDLYRSPTSSMDDAQYIDTLKIENMNAHPNGEANLSFTISLDEENKLTANMVDQETGTTTDSTIPLISRTLEERLPFSDVVSIFDPDNPDSQSEDFTLGDAEFSDTITSDDSLSLDNLELPDSFAEDKSLSLDALETPDALSSDDSLSLDNLELPDSFAEDKSTSLDALETPDALSSDDSLSLDNLELPDSFAEENVSSDDDVLSFDNSETASDETLTVDETAENDFSLGDFSSDDISDNEELPDISIPLENSMDSEMTETALEEEPQLQESSFEQENLLSNSEELFREPVASESDDILSDDLLNTDDIFEETTSDSNDIFTEQPSHSSDNNDGRISFTGLYDKETVLGNSASRDETVESTKKKTKIPVIICIICAGICILATLLLLLIIPSKYNLISKKSATNSNTAIAGTELAIDGEEPPAPQAKDNEVVTVEKAEKAKPVAIKKKKTGDVKYTIKWGDTLWDIAGTFYKNPWRYKKIASYNNIKNPDHIISGTVLNIPAE